MRRRRLRRLPSREGCEGHLELVVLFELRVRDHQDQRAPPALLARDHLAHFVHVQVLEHSELIVVLRERARGSGGGEDRGRRGTPSGGQGQGDAAGMERLQVNGDI